MQNNELEQKDEAAVTAESRPDILSGYSKNQKIASATLGIFAMVVIVMWIVQFKNGLSAPFTYKGDSGTVAENNGLGEEDSALSLKIKDTDGDGLSDYDELNTYKTSPYIEDSDSDGFKDKEEVDSGKDPNCPAGSDCFVSGLADKSSGADTNTGESTSNSLESLLQISPQTVEPTGGSTGAAAGLSQSDIESLVSGEMPAATLRELLISAGMDKAVLDKISDEDLLSSYKDSLSEN